MPFFQDNSEREIDELKVRNHSLQNQINDLNVNLQKQLNETREQYQKQISDYAKQSVSDFYREEISSEVFLF